MASSSCMSFGSFSWSGVPAGRANLLRMPYAILRKLYAVLRWCQGGRQDMTGAEPVADRAGDGGAAGGGAAGGGAARSGAVDGGAVDEAGLPATVAAAWGVRERPHKGPKPALSLARIVSAAVRVADAEGLDAVSMGRVAAELGAAPMSLYRHVSSKEELLTLMVDAAWGDSPPLRAPDEGWRAGLSRWAWTMRTQIRRHPWAVRIPLHSLPIMPREVAWFENAL